MFTMKQFVFDRLIDRENICNQKHEQDELRKAVKHGSKMVVYGPRNYGKTSIVRNVIIEEFKKSHRKHFVYFVDLLGVRDIHSLTGRMTASLQRSFSSSFPVKGLLENARRFLGSLRPEISIDSQTGVPNISLKTDDSSPAQSIQALWENITGITSEIPSLIVLDEFQDIAFINEGPSMMRTCLESLGDTPVLILGSKRHILSGLFAKPSASLNGWGTDLEFKAIPYDEYHQYIVERFETRQLSITFDHAVHLQDSMLRVPEAINRLCFQMQEVYENTDIDEKRIAAAIERLLENREGRYAAYLSAFSGTDERVVCEIARRSPVRQPQGKDFVAALNLSSRTAGLAVKRLMDSGVLEFTPEGYRIGDPLLAAYIRHFR